MDANGHINNVTYLAWAMESVPAEVYASLHLAELEIDFKAECHEGDTVECLSCQLPTLGEAAANGGEHHSTAVNGTPVNGVAQVNGASSSSKSSASSSSSNGKGGDGTIAFPGAQQFMHVLRKRDGDSSTEVWRARTTWITPPPV